jgi:hypothetical protein
MCLVDGFGQVPVHADLHAALATEAETRSEHFTVLGQAAMATTDHVPGLPGDLACSELSLTESKTMIRFQSRCLVMYQQVF